MSINMIEDQRIFMEKFEQSTGVHNEAQYQLYKKLIAEEFEELCDATTPVDELDALCDIMVVTLGAMHSLGIDPQAAWDEVIRSNMSKLCPVTGKPIKREDGKVMKPDTYSPADFKQFFSHQKG